MYCALFWLIIGVCLRETVEGSGFLPQASMPRLGEISSNSPILHVRAVAQVTSSSFEREHISLKRGGLA